MPTHCRLIESKAATIEKHARTIASLRWCYKQDTQVQAARLFHNPGGTSPKISEVMTTGSTTEGTSTPATPVTLAATGYMLDTNVFNRVVEGEFAREDLPADAELFVTHQQVAELASTPDSHKEKRIQMMLALLVWRPVLVPTAMVWDAARWGHSAWSDGDDFTALRSALDALNKGKPNNVADCLIAEAAFAHGHTLVTTDGALAATLQAHGGLVMKLE